MSMVERVGHVIRSPKSWTDAPSVLFVACFLFDTFDPPGRYPYLIWCGNLSWSNDFAFVMMLCTMRYAINSSLLFRSDESIVYNSCCFDEHK